MTKTVRDTAVSAQWTGWWENIPSKQNIPTETTIFLHFILFFNHLDLIWWDQIKLSSYHIIQHFPVYWSIILANVCYQTVYVEVLSNKTAEDVVITLDHRCQTPGLAGFRATVRVVTKAQAEFGEQHGEKDIYAGLVQEGASPTHILWYQYHYVVYP